MQGPDLTFDTDRVKFVTAVAPVATLQGGPSASGKKYVDIKFKVPLMAWVRG